MLDPNKLRHAVDLQQRSYRLLRWTAKAVESNFLQFDAAHEYFDAMSEAAEAWLLRHYRNIPPDVRPAREDIKCFSAFFSTYLENSFDLVANPGVHRRSPHGNCLCSWCSWQANAPNLKTKKVTSSDKRHARNLKIAAVQAIAAGHDTALSDEDAAAIVDDPAMRETVALVAYGHDLLRRMQGIAEGPAVLALWRGFAWTETGSPKKGFRLEAEAILDAEKELLEVVLLRLGSNR